MDRHDPVRCFLGFLAAGAALAAETATVDATAALKALSIDHGTVVSVVHSDGAAPGAKPGAMPRTVVRIKLSPASGSNINIECCLPEPSAWTGRFVGLGNGGAAGGINSDALANAARGGDATATTDMGTNPAPQSGIGNHEVWKDFGYRATHLMTVVGKQVVAAHYGKAPTFSYFVGGSTGGQQSLQEAQRYPEDYDGIIAAVPAHCRTPLHAYFLWNDQILRACPFTQGQEANIVRAGIEYMASREVAPVAGKAVSDPRCTAADIAAVIKHARELDPSLTDAHAEAMRKLFDGPKHALTGERIFNGIPFGVGFAQAHGHLYLFNWVFGGKDLASIDFGKDFDAYTAALGPYLDAGNPDLTPFAKHGGKLIIVSGTADCIVPYHATLDYYERVIARCGGLEQTQAFCRFFLMPGMGHGGSPANLGHLIAWREKGTPVDSFPWRVAGEAMTVYPYPAKAGPDGKPVAGPRGGVDPVAERFTPPPAE